MPDKEEAVPYRSPRRLAKTVVALLAVQALMCLGRLLVTLLVGPGSAAGSSEAEIDIGAALLGLFALLGGLAYFLTAIFFIVWMHRLFCNLSYFSVIRLKAREWQFAWSWFIPIYCFFKPYQLMAELWKASSPDELDPADWETEKVSKLVMGWWLLYLATLLSSNWASAFDRLNRDRGPVIDAGIIQGAFIADDLITIIAAAVAIMLVLQMTKRQEQKREAIDEEAAEPGAEAGAQAQGDLETAVAEEDRKADEDLEAAEDTQAAADDAETTAGDAETEDTDDLGAAGSGL